MKKKKKIPDVRSLGTRVSYSHKFSSCRGLQKKIHTKTKIIQGMNSSYFKPLQMVDSLGISLLWPPAEVMSLTLKQPVKLVLLKAVMMPFYDFFELFLTSFFFLSYIHRYASNELLERGLLRISYDWEVRKRASFPPGCILSNFFSILIWY